MLKLWEGKLEELAPKAISLAVYGAWHLEVLMKDIDVLVIGTEQTLIMHSFHGNKVGHELQVTVIPYYEWESRKKKDDPFVLSVLTKHILFTGAEL